jgi:hypothetical protein
VRERLTERRIREIERKGKRKRQEEEDKKESKCDKERE